jgi:hypothetical protein
MTPISHGKKTKCRLSRISLKTPSSSALEETSYFGLSQGLRIRIRANVAVRQGLLWVTEVPSDLLVP